MPIKIRKLCKKVFQVEVRDDLGQLVACVVAASVEEAKDQIVQEKGEGVAKYFTKNKRKKQVPVIPQTRGQHKTKHGSYMTGLVGKIKTANWKEVK